MRASDQAYRTLRTDILEGQLRPGTVLAEVEQSTRLGVSRTPLREALTREAAKRALAITALGNEFTPAGEMIDERSVVNGVVGLHATGGSTNHLLHLVAIARAAGIDLRWDGSTTGCLDFIGDLFGVFDPEGSKVNCGSMCREGFGNRTTEGV